MTNSLSVRKVFGALHLPTGSFNFPRSLQTVWKPNGKLSLRSNLERMLIDPRMGTWYLKHEDPEENHEWTNHCQGVASDGSSWYFSFDKDADSVERGVFKLSMDFAEVQKTWRPGKKMTKDHIGDIDLGYFRGQNCLFVPYEDVDGGPGYVTVLDTNLSPLLELAPLRGAHGPIPPTHNKAPWIAYNQGNGLVYTSVYNNKDYPHTVGPARLGRKTRLEAFDAERKFEHVPEASIQLDRVLNDVQGACFNLSGHVFISQKDVSAVLGFSTYTGALLGSVPFEMDQRFEQHELAEGICWAPVPRQGIKCGLHFVLLDQDLNGDDIFFKHFATGDLE